MVQAVGSLSTRNRGQHASFGRLRHLVSIQRRRSFEVCGTAASDAFDPKADRLETTRLRRRTLHRGIIRAHAPAGSVAPFAVICARQDGRLDRALCGRSPRPVISSCVLRSRALTSLAKQPGRMRYSPFCASPNGHHIHSEDPACSFYVSRAEMPPSTIIGPPSRSSTGWKGGKGLPAQSPLHFAPFTTRLHGLLISSVLRQ